MSDDKTTVTNNIFVLAQNKLDAAIDVVKQAKAAYQLNHSDENLQAMEDARRAYLTVESSVRSLLKVR